MRKHCKKNHQQA
jgi:hypothetical protein